MSGTACAALLPSMVLVLGSTERYAGHMADAEDKGGEGTVDRCSFPSRIRPFAVFALLDLAFRRAR